MISPSSNFKPKINDQDYMELVCENGQILAKSRRPKNYATKFQNQRTQSLLDLYETEYYEGFKNNINDLGDTQVVPVSESPKNVEVNTAPPDEQSAAVGMSTELYFASSSMFSRGTSRDLSCCFLKRKYEDIEEEESTYLSNNSDDESDDPRTQLVHARTRKQVTKRKRNTEVHKLSERKRRNEINKRMRALQDLLPNCYKDDKVSLLDEAIKYMRTLQLQLHLQMMSMGNGIIRPATMLPIGHYSPMGLGMHMGAVAATSLPQILPMNVQGTGFSGINNASSQMLSCYNHPTGLIPNSPIFSPLENCSQQSVVPSCVPKATSFTQTEFPKSASTSDLEDAMQFRGRNDYYRSLN